MTVRTGTIFAIVLTLFAASLSSHITPEAFAQTGGANTPPVLVVPAIASAYPELERLELDFGVTDSDSGQSHTFALTGTDSNLVDSFDAATGVLAWTPDETEDGTYSFTVTVTDDHATDPQSDSHTFELVISEQNTQPSLGSPDTSTLINELELIVLPGVPATDPDIIDGVADELTFSITSGAPAGLTLHPTIGVSSWRPTEEQDGIHQMVIQVTDGESPPVTFDYEIRVSEINSPPIGTPIPAQTAVQGVPFDLDVTGFFVDPDVVGGIPDAPEYSLGDSPPDWLSIDGATGVFAGTATREIIDGAPSNPLTVTVVASDRLGVQARQSFGLTLAPNEQPVLNAIGPQTGIVGTSLTFTATATDADLPPNTLTFSLDDGASGSVPAGAAIDPTTGAFEWTPQQSQIAEHTFDVMVSDGVGGSDSETVTVTVVQAINGAPSLTGQAFVADDPDNEDSVYGLEDVFIVTFDRPTNKIAGDTMTDDEFNANFVTSEDLGEVFGIWNNPSTFTLIVDAANGAPVIGTTTISAAPGTTIRDPANTAAITGTSNPLSGDFGNDNNPPVLVVPAIASSYPELERLELDFGVTDADSGQSHTFALTGTDSDLVSRFEQSTGVLAWVPDEGEDGTYSFTVTVTDNHTTDPQSDSHTFDLVISEVNTAPKSSGRSAIILEAPESELYTFSPSFVSDSDVIDGVPDELTFSLTDASGYVVPDGLSIDPDTGVISWTPTEQQDGEHASGVIVSDGEDTLSFAYIFVISEENLPPVGTPIPAQTAVQGVPFDLDVTGFFSDPDVYRGIPDAPEYSLGDSPPDWLSFDGATGVFAGTATREIIDGAPSNPLTVTVVASDRLGVQARQSFGLTLAPNEPPVLNAIGPQTGIVGTAITFTATATDADVPPNTLTFSLDDGASGSVPAGAAIDPTTGAFAWTPQESEIGPHTFDVIVSDGVDGSDSETVTVTVADDINSAPVLTVPAIASSYLELERLELDFGVTDADSGQSHTFALTGTDSDLVSRFEQSTGVLAWVPAEDEDGTYSFTVTVTDDHATDPQSDSHTFDLVISEVNARPTASAPQLTVITNEHVPVPQVIHPVTDPDIIGGVPDELRYTVSSDAPDGLSIDPDTGAISWTPTESQDGDHQMTIRVSDGQFIAFYRLLINVIEVNSPPVLDPIEFQAVREGTPLTFTATATDADVPANTLTFSLEDGASGSVPAGAAIDPATGVFEWETDFSDGGFYTFDVMVSDGAGGSDSETAHFIVSDISDFERPSLDERTLRADDPDNLDDVYGAGDTFRMFFRGTTGATAGDTMTDAQFNADFVASEDLGEVSGVWLDDRDLLLTVDVANGAPVIGTTTISARPGSLFIGTTAAMTGDFGIVPVILSITAFGTDNGDTVYSVDDRFLIEFNHPTTMSRSDTMTDAQFNANFVTSEDLGEVSGWWFTDRDLLLRVLVANGAPVIGTTTVSAAPGITIGIRDTPETLFTGTSSPLTGSFGRPVSSLIGQAFVAADPDDGDRAYGIGDTFAITFAHPTDATAGDTMTDAQFNANFVTSEDLGEVSGIWSDPSTLLLTVDVANGAPVIGTTTVSAAPGATIGSMFDSDVPISGTSNPLSGAFGDANSAPVLDPIGQLTGIAGTPITFTATATDADVPPDTLAFSLEDGATGSVPAGAAIDPTTGAFAWTPQESDIGPHTFDVTVFDGVDGSDSETVTVTVMADGANSAPVLTVPAITSSYPEQVELRLNFDVTDADSGQSHTFALTGTGSNLVDSFDAATGVLVWTPDESDDGAYRFTVTVTDDHATAPLSDSHTFDLVIEEVNRPPVLDPIGPRTGDVDTLITFTASATDADLPANTLTFSLDPGATGSVPAGAAIDPTTGAFEWTPQQSQIAAHAFDVMVFDGTSSDSETITVTIAAGANNAPVLVVPAIAPSYPEQVEFELDFGVTDSDSGQSHTFALTGTGSNLVDSFDTATGILVWTPDESDDGAYRFTVTVTDDHPTDPQSDSRTFELLIEEQNTAPVLDSIGSRTGNAGTLITFTATATDEDIPPDTLTFSLVDGASGYVPSGAAIDPTSGVFEWTPQESQIAAHAFDVVVSDGTDSDSETVTVIVAVGANNAPVLIVPTIASSYLEQQLIELHFGVADVDSNQSHTFALTGTGSSLVDSFDAATGVLVWTPDEIEDDALPVHGDSHGRSSYRFTVTVTDDHLTDPQSDSRTFELLIQGQSDDQRIPDDKPQTKKSGESREYLKAPTFGKSRLNNNQVVECGYSVDGLCIDVLNYHEEYKRQTILTNSTHDFTLKTFGQSPIKQFQIGFGVAGVGEPVNNAEAVIRVTVAQDPKSVYSVESVEITDRNNTIDFEPENASVQKVSCMGDDDDDNDGDARHYSPYHADNIGVNNNAGNNNNNDNKTPQCVELSLDGVLFREQFHSEPFVIHVMDSSHRSSHNYMNEGLIIQGPSLNPAHTASKLGMPIGTSDLVRFELTRTDKLADIWTDQFGHTWTRNSFGTWLQLTFPEVRHGQGDDDAKSVKVMTRVHSNFADLIMGEQNRATLVFDAASIINPIPETFSHDYSGSDHDLTRLQKLADQIKVEQERAQKILDFIVGNPART